MKQKKLFYILSLLFLYFNCIGSAKIYMIYPYWINGTAQMIDLNEVKGEEFIYLFFDYPDYITFVPEDLREYAAFDFSPSPKSVKYMFSEKTSDKLKIDEVKKLNWGEAKDFKSQIRNKDQKYPTILFRAKNFDNNEVPEDYLIASNVPPYGGESDDDETDQTDESTQDDKTDQDDKNKEMNEENIIIKITKSIIEIIRSFIKKIINYFK